MVPSALHLILKSHLLIFLGDHLVPNSIFEFSSKHQILPLYQLSFWIFGGLAISSGCYDNGGGGFGIGSDLDKIATDFAGFKIIISRLGNHSRIR